MAKMTILNREEDFLKDLEKEMMTIKHQMLSETYRIKGWVTLTCMIDINFLLSCLWGSISLNKWFDKYFNFQDGSVTLCWIHMKLKKVR